MDQPSDRTALTRAEREGALDTLLHALAETYVFPENAARMVVGIRKRAAHNEYDSVADPEALARRWTEDLQEFSRDKHLRVRYSPEKLPPEGTDGPSEEEREGFRRMAAARNGEFVRVERLDGNVGCIRLDAFLPAGIAGETAAAAMTFLADTDALVFDLRHNRGGDPTMIALITSYLFGPEPVHLNDLYWRPTDSTQQFWTQPHVPGRRFGPEKPVTVLTSARTFSGAEEFCYNLQALKRATVVGETTAGGAHPGGTVHLSDHLCAFIPTGRAINPITGTNWEGTGVEPDVKVPADDALRVAHILALERLEGADAIPPLMEERRETLARLRGES